MLGMFNLMVVDRARECTSDTEIPFLYYVPELYFCSTVVVPCEMLRRHIPVLEDSLAIWNRAREGRAIVSKGHMVGQSKYGILSESATLNATEIRIRQVIQFAVRI
jgi:hypothetical protein